MTLPIFAVFILRGEAPLTRGAAQEQTIPAPWIDATTCRPTWEGPGAGMVLS